MNETIQILNYCKVKSGTMISNREISGQTAYKPVSARWQIISAPEDNIVKDVCVVPGEMDFIEERILYSYSLERLRGYVLLRTQPVSQLA